VKPFACGAAADPYVALPQVNPVPAEELLGCKSFCAITPVVVNGIAMQVVKHVKQ
jgi:hypothetical protein